MSTSVRPESIPFDAKSIFRLILESSGDLQFILLLQVLALARGYGIPVSTPRQNMLTSLAQ